MDYSQPSTSSGSGGFVYFANEKETDDFLPFNTTGPPSSSPYKSSHNTSNFGNQYTTPPSSQFNPPNYSSPYANKRKYPSPGGFQNKRGQYNQNWGSSDNRSFNKSDSGNLSFNNSDSVDKSFNNSGFGNRSFNKSGFGNRSFNKSGFGNRSFNNSRRGNYNSNNSGRGRGRKNFNKSNYEAPIEKYFHPSMLEDPWATLEKDFREKHQNEVEHTPN